MPTAGRGRRHHADSEQYERFFRKKNPNFLLQYKHCILRPTQKSQLSKLNARSQGTVRRRSNTLEIPDAKT